MNVYQKYSSYVNLNKKYVHLVIIIDYNQCQRLQICSYHSYYKKTSRTIQNYIKCNGTKLEANYTGFITTLDGLDTYEDIEEVLIEQTHNLVSISGITFLRKLAVLKVANCPKVTDFSQVLDQQYIALVTLDLSGNNLEDISFIVKSPNIQNLIITNNKITTIEPINELKKLKYLNMSTNKLTSSVIAQLKNKSLESLDLSINEIDNLEFIASMPQIKQLFLQDNNLDDSNQIQYFKYLIDLDLLQCNNNPFVHNFDYYTCLKQNLRKDITVCIAGIPLKKADFQ